jgi:hypothetical protein
MSSVDSLEIRFRDKVLEANYSLWNALLTVNGIMLTAFSVFAVAVPTASKPIAIILAVCCVVSGLLLVLNHLAVQRHYTTSGQQYARGVLPDEAQRKAEVSAAAKEFATVRSRQQWALWLLLVEAVLVAVLVLGAWRSESSTTRQQAHAAATPAAPR